MGAPDWFVDVFPIEKVENSSQRCVSLPEGNIKKKLPGKNIGKDTILVCPKIGMPPKWMVKIMENPIKMDDLGVSYIWKHPFCVRGN